MSATFLELIIAERRRDVAILRSSTHIDGLIYRAREFRNRSTKHRLSTALSKKGRTNIIAEIKRASPSRGVINADIDVAERARQYVLGGAAAISVLTEATYFHGSLDDLRIARAAVDEPILRKDFFVDEFQIYEAAEAGADAILLIVAALSRDELAHLRTIAEEELGMDALVEVHTIEEIHDAQAVGATLIGVNNRDLHTLSVSLDVSRELIRYKPSGTLMIAESGISKSEELAELKRLGFDGFLVGESLMRSGDAAATLEAWV